MNDRSKFEKSPSMRVGPYRLPLVYFLLIIIITFVCKTQSCEFPNNFSEIYTLGKKGCYTPGWCVFFVIISISSVREV